MIQLSRDGREDARRGGRNARKGVRGRRRTGDEVPGDDGRIRRLRRDPRIAQATTPGRGPVRGARPADAGGDYGRLLRPSTGFDQALWKRRRGKKKELRGPTAAAPQGARVAARGRRRPHADGGRGHDDLWSPATRV
ncbi:hypothetical protein ACHAWF_003851 [Thalassiosira exigua]